MAIGRDEKENDILEQVKQNNDILIELKKETGPLAILRIYKGDWPALEKQFKVFVPNNIDKYNIENIMHETVEDIIKQASVITAFYAKKLRGQKVDLKITK